jgi:hypothetical protein
MRLDSEKWLTMPAYTIYAFFEWALILFDVAFDAVTALDFETFELVVKDVKGASRGYVQLLPKYVNVRTGQILANIGTDTTLVMQNSSKTLSRTKSKLQDARSGYPHFLRRV